MKTKDTDFGLTLIAQLEFAALMVTVYCALGSDEIWAVVQGFADEPSEGDCANALPALERGMRVVMQYATELCFLDLSKLRSLEKNGMAILEAACRQLRARGTQISFIMPEDCVMTNGLSDRLLSLSGENSLINGAESCFTLTSKKPEEHYDEA